MMRDRDRVLILVCGSVPDLINQLVRSISSAVTEIRMRNRVRKARQLLLHSTEKFVKQDADALAVGKAELVDILAKQI